MFESQETRIAREILKLQEKEKNRPQVSDAEALSVIALGGALIAGIVNSTVYITITSMLFPIGVMLTTTGLVGLGVKTIKNKKRGK